jgi:hypothetical protein
MYCKIDFTYFLFLIITNRSLKTNFAMDCCNDCCVVSEVFGSDGVCECGLCKAAFDQLLACNCDYRKPCEFCKVIREVRDGRSCVGCIVGGLLAVDDECDDSSDYDGGCDDSSDDEDEGLVLRISRVSNF